MQVMNNQAELYFDYNHTIVDNIRIFLWPLLIQQTRHSLCCSWSLYCHACRVRMLKIHGTKGATHEIEMTQANLVCLQECIVWRQCHWCYCYTSSHIKRKMAAWYCLSNILLVAANYTVHVWLTSMGHSHYHIVDRPQFIHTFYLVTMDLNKTAYRIVWNP